MKKRIRSFGMFMIAAAVIGTGLSAGNTTQAQDNESLILSWSDFTIKAGHNTQFREGFKAWKNCYIDNNGDWNWNIWHRVRGEGNVYMLASFMENWAEMDEPPGEAGRACSHLVQNLIYPHIESVNSGFSRTMPELSRQPGDLPDVISVIYWRVNNGRLFIDTVREVVSTIRSVEGDARGYWYGLVSGSKNSAHYAVVTAHENFASLDNQRDGVWAVVENEHGAERREQLQNDYRESIDQSWTYFYRRVADMSHPDSD